MFNVVNLFIEHKHRRRIPVAPGFETAKYFASGDGNAIYAGGESTDEEEEREEAEPEKHDGMTSLEQISELDSAD